jgi:hypothetical protein
VTLIVKNQLSGVTRRFIHSASLALGCWKDMVIATDIQTPKNLDKISNKQQETNKQQDRERERQKKKVITNECPVCVYHIIMRDITLLNG